MPEQPVDNSNPQSRTAEFSSGATGLTGQGSTTIVHAPQAHTELPSTPYKPSSVLSPIGGSGIGQSASTYSANRALSFYRS
jgi:hypothetical protein